MGIHKRHVRFSKPGTAFALRGHACVLEYGTSLGHNVITFSRELIQLSELFI